MKNKIKRIIGYFFPLGIIVVFLKLTEPHRQRKLQKRVQLLLSEWEEKNQELTLKKEITREEIIALLCSWGLDVKQVNAGSIVEEDLKATYNFIKDNLSLPVIGVHVGNFVGVSLAYIATRLKKLDERNVIISIDPNLPHRGISNTEGIVTKLLRVLGVADMVIRLNGYSLSKSISNDGREYGTDYDPFQHFLEEDAPEWQLKNLAKILKGKVDFVMLDGNHDANYLKEEVEVCYEFLREGGIIFLDDITDVWIGLKNAFQQLSKEQVFQSEFIGTRTGVLIKR